MKIQIINHSILIFFVLILFNFQVNQCSSSSNRNIKEDNNNNSNSKQNSFQILNKVCTKENVCYLMVYIDSVHFNEKDLLKASKSLSKKFSEMKGITVNLFDDLELATAYATGKKEQLNLLADVRGRYLKGGGEEILMFSPDKSRINDSNNVIILNLQDKK